MRREGASGVWRAMAGVALVIMVALAAVAPPVLEHVRAARLLARFGDADAGPPAGVIEEALAVPHANRSPTRARLYRPGGQSRGAMVLVPGVHRLGVDEPRLVRFARAIAASGVTVLTAEMAALVNYRIDDAAPEDIGDAAHALHERAGAPVGVMGMSFAGGLALLAATEDRYRSDVAFVVAVGAHDDLARVARFFATNAIARPDGSIATLAAHPYGPCVLVYDHAEDFFAPADRAAARDALRLWLWEEKDAARAKLAALPAGARAELEALFDGNLEAITPRLLAEIDARAAAMRAVSPHERLAGLEAPVFLLHGAGDSVIPATETSWLALDVPRRLVRDVLVSPALVHVELEGEPSWREKLALIHFMAEVLDAADGEAAGHP